MNKQILLCKCGVELSKKYNLDKIEAFLKQNAIPYVVLEDLCGLAVKNKNILQELFSLNTETLLISCYARTNKLLLKYAEIDSDEIKLQFANHRQEDYDEIISVIRSFAKYLEEFTCVKNSVVKSGSSWPSWFPLIDIDRCTNCGQCADFCLFGVYKKGSEQIDVVNPEYCKNLCPACARICPNYAIIFPKFDEGGAISGEDIVNEEVEKTRFGNDLQAITNGDIYKTLELRKRKRKSIIKQEAINKANAEREEALKKYGNK